MGNAQLLGHRDRHHQTARFERAGRQTSLIFYNQILPIDAKLCCSIAECDKRGFRLAKTDNILGLANGQHFPVTPHITRAGIQLITVQMCFERRHIIMDPIRPPGWGELVQHVGFSPRPLQCTGKVCNECSAVCGEIYVAGNAHKWLLNQLPSTYQSFVQITSHLDVIAKKPHMQGKKSHMQRLPHV